MYFYLFSEMYRYFAVGFSVLGASKTMYDFQQRKNVDAKTSCLHPIKIVSYLLKVIEFGPRIMILAVFVYAVRTYCVIFFFAHSIVYITIVFVADCHKKQTNSDEGYEAVYESLISMLRTLLRIFTSTFFAVDIDVSEVSKRRRFCLYILYYVENSALLSMYLKYTKDQDVWYYYGSTAIVIIGFIFHISLYRISRHMTPPTTPADDGQESAHLVEDSQS
jgi:hypothetical protein